MKRRGFFALLLAPLVARLLPTQAEPTLEIGAPRESSLEQTWFLGGRRAGKTSTLEARCRAASESLRTNGEVDLRRFITPQWQKAEDPQTGIAVRFVKDWDPAPDLYPTRQDLIGPDLSNVEVSWDEDWYCYEADGAWAGSWVKPGETFTVEGTYVVNPELAQRLAFHPEAFALTMDPLDVEFATREQWPVEVREGRRSKG